MENKEFVESETELTEQELNQVDGGVWHDYINPGYWAGVLYAKVIGPICIRP